MEHPQLSSSLALNPFRDSLWPRLSTRTLVLVQLALKLLHRAKAIMPGQATNTWGVSRGPRPSIPWYSCYYWCLTLMCVLGYLYKHHLSKSSHKVCKLDIIIFIFWKKKMRLRKIK